MQAAQSRCITVDLDNVCKGVFSCRLAVKTIKRFSGDVPVVEIGAGLGYWAQTLKNSGVDVRPFDIHPPNPAAKEANEYHGFLSQVFVGQMGKGGPKALAGFGSKVALLLCYPPPGSSMASDCLKHFRSESFKLSSRISYCVSWPDAGQDLF